MAESKKPKRRARAAIVWGVAVFAVSQCLLYECLRSTAPEVLSPEYGLQLRTLRARMAAAPDGSLTVVAMGSSRTLQGLRCESLEQCLDGPSPVVAFSVTKPGAGPVTQLIYLRRLIRDGVRPDFLLVEVVPPFLAGHVPCFEATEPRFPTDFLLPEDRPVVERYFAPERSRPAWQPALDRLAVCYSARAEIQGEFAPPLVPLRHLHRNDNYRLQVDRWGWMRTGGDEPSTAALEWARSEYSPFMTPDFRVSGPAPRALRESLTICRRERIPVALVLMPEGPAYRGWYPDGAWRQVEDFLGRLSREFNVPVINTRDWLAEDDFRDSHHMLPRSTRAFTERLACEKIAPLLRRPGTQRPEEYVPQQHAPPDSRRIPPALAERPGRVPR
jgi:hypothetical protein